VQAHAPIISLCDRSTCSLPPCGGGSGWGLISDDGVVRVAVLDDYQGVARDMADWGSLPDGAQVSYFHDHLTDEDELVSRLRGFEVVVAMRERTPFPRSLLAR